MELFCETEGAITPVVFFNNIINEPPKGPDFTNNNSNNNCQTPTSGVLSSQNHKQRQTTGGLFSNTFRASVPIVSLKIVIIIIIIMIIIIIIQKKKASNAGILLLSKPHMHCHTSSRQRILLRESVSVVRRESVMPVELFVYLAE